MTGEKQPKPNTVNRDHDYGTFGNMTYDWYKSIARSALNNPNLSSDAKHNYIIHKFEDMQTTGIKLNKDASPAEVKVHTLELAAAHEAIEDAYLEAHLPSPFPYKAVQKPKTANSK